MNDESINVHVNRYSLVESINSMINYNNINDNNETMRVFDNIKNQLLTSHLLRITETNSAMSLLEANSVYKPFTYPWA